MAKNIRKAVLLLAMLSVIVGMFTACSNKKSDDGRTTFTVGFDAEFHLMVTRMIVENM